jgi:acetoacetate decarboxylase
MIHDLTQMLLEDGSAKNFMRGPAALEFNALADNEELGPMQPTEVLGGYRWQTSWVMPGIKIVHDYLAKT